MTPPAAIDATGIVAGPEGAGDGFIVQINRTMMTTMKIPAGQTGHTSASDMEADPNSPAPYSHAASIKSQAGHEELEHQEDAIR